MSWIGRVADTQTLAAFLVLYATALLAVLGLAAVVLAQEVAC